MNNDSFKEVLAWSQSKGVKVHPAVERRCVNGIYGMYATAPIARYDVLVSYPNEAYLPPAEEGSFPKEFEEVIRYGCAAAKEYALGDSSDWHGLLRSLEPLDSLRSTSAYFLSDTELEQLKLMSPLLHRIVVERNMTIRQQVEGICASVAGIDEQDALVVALNLKTRSWKKGFCAIVDQFNHSDYKGAVKCSSDRHSYIMANMDYEAGQEVFVSYGRRDIYDFVIDYDFFDASDRHYINFGNRGSQLATSDIERQVIRYAATKHKLDMSETREGLHYQLDDDGALLLELGPSEKLINYVKDTAYRSKKEFKAKRCTQKSFDIRMNDIIKALLSSNRVQHVPINQLPEKLHRFHHALTKEHKMLVNNLQWVNANSPLSSRIPLDVRKEVGDQLDRG